MNERPRLTYNKCCGGLTFQPGADAKERKGGPSTPRMVGVELVFGEALKAHVFIGERDPQLSQ